MFEHLEDRVVCGLAFCSWDLVLGKCSFICLLKFDSVECFEGCMFKSDCHGGLMTESDDK